MTKILYKFGVKGSGKKYCGSFLTGEELISHEKAVSKVRNNVDKVYDISDVEIVEV